MTNKKSTEAKSPKEDPWDSIIGSHHSFLNDIECISEMVSLVLPVLKKKDIERDARIKELSVEINTEKGKKFQIKFVTDINEFIGHINKVRIGDRMFRHSVITSVVAKFDEFFSEILRYCYRENSEWLKNPDKKISYAELLGISSLETLKSEIISKEIDGIMRESHYDQITFLDKKLKLGIEREFPGWSDFLEITERRNLFVHTGGYVSAQYLENCRKWDITLDERIKDGIRLSASDKYIQNAIDCFYEISLRVAQATVRRLFPDSFEDADTALNNPGVDLLSEKRWILAERIYEFALNIPEDLTSGSEIKLYYLINKCIALKNQGKDINETLHSVNWKPFHPKYLFAVAILEERYEEAEELMRSPAVLDQVKEQHFMQWPLLRDFRKRDEFLRAFSDIFGKDYDDELIEEAERKIKSQQEDEIVNDE